MNIEITRPEVEALIQQRLRSRAFKDPQDLILHALRASENRPAVLTIEEIAAEIAAARRARRQPRP
jgi:hypothetical protein